MRAGDGTPLTGRDAPSATRTSASDVAYAARLWSCRSGSKRMPASFSSGRERSSIVSSGGTFCTSTHLASGESVVNGGGGASTTSAISFGGILYCARRGTETSRRMARKSRFFMVPEDNAVMPTLTIRNVPAKTVRALKALAKRNGHSMEQELREMLKRQVLDRASATAQLEQFWASKERRATPEEIEAGIREGRP